MTVWFWLALVFLVVLPISLFPYGYWLAGYHPERDPHDAGDATEEWKRLL